MCKQLRCLQLAGLRFLTEIPQCLSTRMAQTFILQRERERERERKKRGMGVCWGDPGFATPSRTGYLKSGVNLTISTSSSSGSGDSSRQNRLVPGGGGNFPIGFILEEPNLRKFTLEELNMATENFRSDWLVGEGGFGHVFKGFLIEDVASGRERTVVAVKRLNRASYQGFKEWMSEVLFLGRLSHPNITKLLGFCWENGQLLLVYEFISKGSLNHRLYGKHSKSNPLSWATRLKIATGAARGLEFLHSSENGILYRDLKSSNILLDGSYNARLSDFGLALFVPSDGRSSVGTRIVGTYGYGAPEYIATGHLYVKSDVYSYGVVLLELLTGLQAIDKNRPQGKANLVEWAEPRLSSERKVKAMIDSRLKRNYPPDAAVQVARLASRCLRREPRERPSMSEVVEALGEINAANKEPRYA
ncbi:probable serine/threonine-protein kinase PIX13 isoform X2 [Punica granatum]|uniref:non-specific serine/threonine protein kinase n=1 Tax=Punica granatum TaxID=22663 RepID=A0A6P8DST9_PUNGR|nr:probable serine/threonine-protein kinase PIX13 isoform X2 [Punica granatum]